MENFSTLTPFVIDSGFQDGINTLDFVVEDVGYIAALRAELSGTADLIEPVVGGVTTEVPEPSTLLLLGAGLAAIGARRRLGR